MAHRSEVQPWTPRSEADSTPVGPDVGIKSIPNFPKVAIKEANAVFCKKRDNFPSSFNQSEGIISAQLNYTMFMTPASGGTLV